MHLRRQMALATVVLGGLAAAAVAQDVLVVTPESFRPALTQWKTDREARGMKVHVKSPVDDVGQLVKAAREETKGRLRYVLLLGDVEQVPTSSRPADAIKAWERDPRIATDNPWADLDGDEIPDVALGRLPADTVEEARAMLARTLAYEANRDFSPWRRRLNLVGGVGGFGAGQDAAIENLTRGFLGRYVPPSIQVTFTYGKRDSPYCPYPPDFAATFAERLNEGSLVTAYVGHGSARQLDRVAFAGKHYPILDASQVAKSLACRHGSPILFIVACSSGHLDGPQDCLAEEVVRTPGGPVAVLASSRVSTPYSNAILCRELLAALFDKASPRLGDLVLASKRALAGDGADDLGRRQIEALAKSYFEPSAERRVVDRREHLSLYHLFGDPTLRIARPVDAELELPEEVDAGEVLRAKFTSPVTGTATFELVRRRQVTPRVAAGREKAEDFASAYAEANDRVVARAQVKVPKAGEAVDVSVTLTSSLRGGRYLVRLYVEGESGAAMAGGQVRVFPSD